MGVQLKVHTPAKIWVLSRQSSRRPLRGTHHTKAVFEDVVGSVNCRFIKVQEVLQPSIRPLSTPYILYFPLHSSLLDLLLTI